MIADYNNMPRMFRECKQKYFNGMLPPPKYEIMHKFYTLGRFCWRKNKKGKHPIKDATIAMTDYYDFDEDTFRDIMVHEMIHYYLLYYGEGKANHGKEFRAMAKELNEKYGLNVEVKKDVFFFKRSGFAPKHASLWEFVTSSF